MVLGREAGQRQSIAEGGQSIRNKTAAVTQSLDSLYVLGIGASLGLGLGRTRYTIGNHTKTMKQTEHTCELSGERKGGGSKSGKWTGGAVLSYARWKATAVTCTRARTERKLRNRC